MYVTLPPASLPMPFSDWPAVAVCPACQQPSGQFLAAVSLETRKPHYLCERCAHTWIPDQKPTPAAPRNPPAPQAV